MKHSPEAAPVSAPARERLELFAALLRRWNRRINLIAPGDESRLWERHICDSAQLVPLLPAADGKLIDLGSGAGFPGLVLSILSPWQVHLVESDLRKAAFLREATRQLEVNASVHALRAETLNLPPADVVTARALAPLPKLLPIAARLLAPGGLCLFPKGRGMEAELTEAAGEWHMRVERFPSRTGPNATLLRLSEIHRAG